MGLVVFRADGGPAIGAGHVMRMLSLAHAFRAGGWRIGFAATEETFASVAALGEAQAEKLVVENREDTRALTAKWPEGADLLFADHYGLDAAFERECRPWAKRIVAIDDLANRKHDADVLFDPVCASPRAYEKLVPPQCAVHCGPDFSSLHPAFREARAAALARRGGGEVNRILVSFGQIDAGNATAEALDAIEAAGFRGAIDVVLSSRAPHLQTIRERVKGRAVLHVDTSEMASLMSAADLAIGAGGTTTWERCCLGLPALAVEIADNQHDLLSRAAASGVLLNLGIAKPGIASEMARALRDLLGNHLKLSAMSIAAATLVDGRGSERILLAALAPESASSGEAVTLRLAETRDKEWLLALQKLPETRQHANNARAPSAEEHNVWFARTLADCTKLLAIVQVAGKPAGMVRLDRRKDAARVSIAILPSFYRRGIGAAALSLLSRVAPGIALEAEVKSGNAPSLALFGNAGYRHLRGDLYIRGPK
ncbi:MAG: UDP-2,4-diacetamido-2,4,6-trideoxy-beta-L-altropyranose hydrolase [Rhizobiales bacterium]|nr:UDP-2,4-diacetamido-2,4,6-trideoxy-beta-L-altropyranose hydrolase [Hyphomicrobiales bacterium]